MDNILVALSDELALAVETAAHVVVALDARPRFPSSGLHWREDLVVAAEHTVRREEDIRVTLPDGRTLAAEIAGRDPATDLAVLKAPGIGAPPAPPGEHGDFRVGELMLSVGRAGHGVAAAMGVVSLVAAPVRARRQGFARLDLAPYTGFSGSAIVDARGRVAGLGTAGPFRGGALAIPLATVNHVAEELLERGHIRRGYLGVGLQPLALPDHLRSKLQREARGAVIVLSVEPASPAAEAGLLLGDILLKLGGAAIADPNDVQAALAPESVGTTVEAEVLRAGELARFTISIGERPRR